MKFTKKLFAAALALCLMLCLSIPAFAENYTDQSKVTIKKVYNLVGDGSSPEETFKLQQIGKSVSDSEIADKKDIPDLKTVTGEATGIVGKVTFAAGAAGSASSTGAIVIELPTYTHVGIYTYTLKEVAGSTAGVTYYGNDIKLVVTVINGDGGNLRVAGVHTESPVATGDKKKDNFPNVYSAGKLNISKTVEGNLGDKDKYFEFKVTLTGEPGKTYGETYAVSGGSDASNPTNIKIGEETTFKLKHSDTITIDNLPYGVSYVVTEDPAGYTVTSKTGDTGTINAAEQTAAFTNEKKGEIDMGVTLDNLPYILVLVAVLGGAVVMFTRKRRFED